MNLMRDDWYDDWITRDRKMLAEDSAEEAKPAARIDQDYDGAGKTGFPVTSTRLVL